MTSILEAATAAAHRPISLAERFDPRPADDARYETAIARRNETWLHWRKADELLAEADAKGVRDRRPYVHYHNETLRDYERASYDLIREKVRWEREGTPW